MWPFATRARIKEGQLFSQAKLNARLIISLIQSMVAWTLMSPFLPRTSSCPPPFLRGFREKVMFSTCKGKKHERANQIENYI